MKKNDSNLAYSLFNFKRGGKTTWEKLQPFYHFVSSVINVYVLYSDYHIVQLFSKEHDWSNTHTHKKRHRNEDIHLFLPSSLYREKPTCVYTSKKQFHRVSNVLENSPSDASLHHLQYTPRQRSLFRQKHPFSHFSQSVKRKYRFLPTSIQAPSFRVKVLVPQPRREESENKQKKTIVSDEFILIMQ